MKSLILIDNYAMVRSGLSSLLKEQLSGEYDLKTVADINHIQIEDLQVLPDIIILARNEQDPGLFLQLINTCKATFPDKRIMVYGDHFTFEEVTNLISKGVTGIVLKANDISVLVKCIREIQNKDYFLCEELMGLIMTNLLPSKQSAQVATPLTRLSAREVEIANYLIVGMKTSDIANRLGRKSTTISTIKNNVFRKMNVDNVMALQKVMVSLSL